jgi:7-cyano-7-deazaguanine synthase
MMRAGTKAIILFSGGLDSTTCLAIAKSQAYDCYALSFSYGQKHHIEVARAKEIAKKIGVIEHKILVLPLDEIRGSSLIDKDIMVPDYSKKNAGIPSTYVPARNTIFLSFALAWAEVIKAEHIFYGANHIDYSQYPDCRPDYIRAFEKLAALATKVGTEGQQCFIHAPLLEMSKADIIREGMRLGIDYSQPISCYRADEEGRACGTCDSCTYRKKGFIEAKVKDPTPYY